MTCEPDNVLVTIVLEVDDSPITLYVWAHLVSATMVEHLSDNGVAANVVHIDVDGLTDTAP